MTSPVAPAPQRPAVWACAALIALPFVFPFAGGPSVNVWQLLASWSCVAFLLVAAPADVPRRGVLAWLAVAAVAVALVRGPDIGYWLPTCLAIVVMALAACVGAGLARGGRAWAAALAWGLLAAGLVNAVLGLLQYFGRADALVPWAAASELRQAYGNLRQRNQFATLISMAVVAALWLHAELPGRRARACLGAATLLLVVAAAASTSRTGLLQLLLIVGVAAFMARRERVAGAEPLRLPAPLALLALVALYLLAAWALPLLAGPEVEGMFRRLRDGTPAGHGRLLLWGNVLDLIGQHPWAGWGWGELSYAHFSTLYAGPRFVEILDNAHSLPLHLAVELGVPAAIAVCGGFAALVLAARPWREREPTRLMAWGVLGAIVLHSLLEYPLWYGPFQLAFGLCLGILWPGGPRQNSASKVPLTPIPRALIATVLIAMVGYAAWDYTRVSQIYLARAERLPAWRDDTLAKLQGSWLFASQVRFAELTLAPLTRADAVRLHALATRALHFSPEPRVVAKLIDSAVLLGLQDEALAQAVRFKLAFPLEYARWAAGEPVELPEAAK